MTHWAKRVAYGLAFTLLAWATPPAEPDPLDFVLQSVYNELGLPADQYGPTFNLARTGKLGTFLVLVADRLNGDHAFTTIEDVSKVFTSLSSQ